MVAGAALVRFESAADVDGWSTVNDPVMGGRSTSDVTWRDSALVFSGELSLENNGGFASVVAPAAAFAAGAWAGRDGIRLEGAGDGKTYVVQLRVGPSGESYVQRFVAGATFDVFLPFGEFSATTRFLQPLPDAPPLAAAQVRGIAIYILDGQTGSFELGIASIG